MKFVLALAAIAAVSTVSVADAATIVQTDSEQGALTGFKGFDTRLGTLDSVTLAVDLAKWRGWRVTAPAGETTANLSWTIDGRWQLRSANTALPQPFIALTGAGTSVVSLDRRSGQTNFGFFEVLATGSASFSLDPSQFLDRDVLFNGYDYGQTIGSGDTLFSGVPVGGTVTQLQGGCIVVNGTPLSPGEDFCGSANYKLTYTYTAASAAVPEPASWALMIAGFATTGAALRRRRRVAAAA